MFPLFPEEERAIANAVAKRRVEFSAGRYCARLAMAQLGYLPCNLPPGPDRTPQWPTGIVGSITHNPSYCAAVVASSRDFPSLGIDMEAVGAVALDLVREVMRPDEIAEFDPSAQADGADWLTVFFCLKEAAYKAFYPVFREILGFQDMRVSVNPEKRTFEAEASALSRAAKITLQGRYLVKQNNVFAASWRTHEATSA